MDEPTDLETLCVLKLDDDKLRKIYELLKLKFDRRDMFVKDRIYDLFKDRIIKDCNRVTTSNRRATYEKLYPNCTICNKALDDVRFCSMCDMPHCDVCVPGYTMQVCNSCEKPTRICKCHDPPLKCNVCWTTTFFIDNGIICCSDPSNIKDGIVLPSNNNIGNHEYEPDNSRCLNIPDNICNDCIKKIV